MICFYFNMMNFPTVIMLVFVALFALLIFCAFKRPEKVKLVGALSLVFPILWNMFGLINAFSVLAATGGEISSTVVYVGTATMALEIFCGLLIYTVSLLLRLAIKKAE